MLAGGLQAALLLGVEPSFDSAAGAAAEQALGKAAMVVTLSPFKSNLEISDVLLPIAPFTETSGSFVNAEGRLQSFQAVVKPAGETRPGWKVLRVLGNMLGLAGFAQDSSRDALALLGLDQVESGSLVPAALLGNQTGAAIELAPVPGRPCVAGIYQLDSIVRRAPSLQLTPDARLAAAAQAQAKEQP